MRRTRFGDLNDALAPHFLHIAWLITALGVRRAVPAGGVTRS